MVKINKFELLTVLFLGKATQGAFLIAEKNWQKINHLNMTFHQSQMYTVLRKEM